MSQTRGISSPHHEREAVPGGEQRRSIKDEAEARGRTIKRTIKRKEEKEKEKEK